MKHPGRSPALILLLALLALGPLHAEQAGAGSAALRTLIVGGGPDPENNQVAIERNVYYVSRLLPAGAARTILFADGDPAAKTVLYEEKPRLLPRAERVFRLLFGTREEAYPTTLRYRAPALPRLDGPARRTAITAAFEELQRGADPVLLYFTGHGSRARNRNLDNSQFDLWGNDRVTVRDLAAQIATLPPEVPVTLVMVQCYSGAFGNLLFAGGDPSGELVDRELVGFFASTRERMSAGCTPELDEAEYHDFTSYFFAALTGRDRVGRRVSGADYDRDGRVGMDEAFAYSLMHDVSIDVPICTSDVFLRRFVAGVDEELFRTPYSRARAWATPAQRVALEHLSRALKLTGEPRLNQAYQRIVTGAWQTLDREDHAAHQGSSRRAGMRQVYNRFERAREEAGGPLLDRWPELQLRPAPGYAEARAQALLEISRSLSGASFRELLAAEKALLDAEEQEYQAELAEARVLRFVRLAKSIILTHRLRESGDTALQQRFDRLIAAESRPLLPPISVAGRPAGALRDLTGSAGTSGSGIPSPPVRPVPSPRSRGGH
jgi:hypothetical protein